MRVCTTAVTVVFCLAAPAIAQKTVTVDTTKGEKHTEGIVTVKLMQTKHLPVALFHVRLEITNTSKDQKEDLDVWRDRLRDASLYDDDDKEYAREIAVLMTTDGIALPSDKPNLFPGRSVLAAITFKQVATRTKFFTMEMPGREGKGVLRIRLKNPEADD